MDIGNLNAKVKLDLSGFDKGVKKITSSFKDIYRNAISLNQSVELVKNGYRGMQATMDATVGSLLDAATTAEGYRLRLDALLGSQQEGTRMFKEMAKFAGQVPFEYEKVMGAATQLSGVMQGGVDEVKEWMPLIADLSAATGISIQDTTSQIQRMYSSGAASADMFKERGVSAMLGFKAGVSYTAEETRQMLMKAYTDPASKFRGLTKEMAKTWEGQTSMMADKWFLFRNEIMDSGPFTVMKAALTEVNDQIDEMVSAGKMTGYAEDIGEVLLSGIDASIIGAQGLANIFAGLYETAVLTSEVYHRIAGMSDTIASKTNGLKPQYALPGIGPALSTWDTLFGDKKTPKDFQNSAAEHSQKADDALARLLSAERLRQDLNEQFKVARDSFAQLVSDYKKGLLDSTESTSKQIGSMTSSAEGATSKAIESLREKLVAMKADAQFNKDTLGIAGVDLDLAKINLQYQEIIAQAPGLRGLADQWKELAEYAATEGDRLEAVQEMTQMIKDAQFEQNTLGMNDLDLEIAEIARQYKEFVTNNPGLESMADQWKTIREEIAKTKNELEGFKSSTQMAAETIDEAFRAMSGSLGDALAEFAQTGKMHFGELISSLIKDLQIVSAHKTARLLMDAAYEGVMALVDPANSAKHSAAAAAALQGAAIMGSFVAGSGLAGMAHDGISSVPEDGTWLLQKGERVVDSRTNEDLKKFMTGSGGINMPMHITIQNSDEQGVKKALPALKQTVIDIVTGNIAGNGEIRKTIKSYT